MKAVNLMNFVRRIDERFENSTERLLNFTTEQLRLVNEYNVDNTFLLQYDAVCDEDFVNLFKNEVSLWSKGFSRVFSNTTVQKHRFFCTQLSL